MSQSTGQKIIEALKECTPTENICTPIENNHYIKQAHANAYSRERVFNDAYEMGRLHTRQELAQAKQRVEVLEYDFVAQRDLIRTQTKRIKELEGDVERLKEKYENN